MKSSLLQLLDYTLGLIGMAFGFPLLVMCTLYYAMLILGRIDVALSIGFTPALYPHGAYIACFVAFVIRQRRYFSRLFRGKT